MMRTSSWFLFLLLIGPIGCESSTSSGGPDDVTPLADTSSSADASASDGTGVPGDALEGDVEEVATDVPVTDVFVAPVGACINGEDLNGLQAKDPRATVQECALKCMSEAGTGCATTCIEESTSLTDGCAACLGGIIECLYERCGTECADGVSPDCDACTLSKGCVADFTACSGISPPK